MAEHRDALAALLRREHFIIIFFITLAVVGAWIMLFLLQHSSMEMSMEGVVFGAAAVMWSIMMVAMMLPSALPMILVFAAVNKKRFADHRVFVPTWIFASGYLLVWILFACVAAFLQVMLSRYAVLSMDMKFFNPLIAGVVLIGAGVYQFTKLKEVCLKNCQTPFDFLTRRWREGKKGALYMGLHHGLFCVGCCWVLMLLLFVAGVMNLVWVALIALFVIVEKLIAKPQITKASGIMLILYGFAIVGSQMLSHVRF